MISNYKRLGDYITLSNMRNKDLETIELLGINIDKFFMPSVANIIDTDLSTYKLVKNNQFACNRMHVGRDYRIPIALSKDDQSFIVSPAYDVFEINDINTLNPNYLDLWFKRKEFDRNSWFYTDADVRGGLSLEAFLDLKLPVPSIEKQLKIVEEYNIIEKRINLNNKLIQKLEETAQILYKHWFVDFEFPNEEGKPYKSSGGKMIFNKELGKEIPKGWVAAPLKTFVECNKDTLSLKDKYETIKYLETSNITNNVIDMYILLDTSKDEIPSRARRKVKKGDIVYSTIRPTLKHYGILREPTDNTIVSTGFAVLRPCYPHLFSELIYLLITSDEILKILQAKAEMSVSTYPSIKPEDILDLSFILPIENILKKSSVIFQCIFKQNEAKQNQNKSFLELKNLLLSRLATIE